MSEDKAGGSPGVRDRLSHERRQELLRGMLQKRAAVQAEETIPRRPAGGAPPLSLAQQRLWLADRLHPGSAAYNMPYRLRLRGALDGAALGRSLDALVARHETLRTTFEERGGDPVQVIHPPAPAALPLVDLRGLRAAGREAEALRIAAEESLRPFDLARGPLLRSLLLRLDGEDHVLCFTLHHIVSDGWSMEVLVREVSLLADAFGRGVPSPLPELPIQYADFAVWQRGRLTPEAMEAQASYWRERLTGAPPLLDVPTDHPRTGREGGGAGTHLFTLSAELSEGLRALSRREGTTLFMTILAGWQALLGRYSGQDDVVVGTPIAGRTRHETAGLIGFFVNNLVMRADLGGDPTWSELLGRVRAAALGAYANQDLPFERLVDELGVDRALPHTPVVQVHFGLNEAGGGGDRKLRLGGLELEPFGAGKQVARYDLDLVVEDAPSGLGGVILFRESLFEPATVARMARHLETLLEAMAAAPERRLSATPLLRGEERARVLGAWSSTAPAPPAGQGVHARFAEQAARTPDAPAVASGDESLTYAELDAASNRLAHRLVRMGVGPEARVAVVLDPGPGLVVALLGVLKAGGAYLPLEPSTPPERLAFVLEDAGVRAVVAREASRAVLRRSPAAAVFLDSDAEELSRELADAPLSHSSSPENAAYLIYTSGSTGQPKGVVVEHRQLAAYVQAVASRLGLAEGMKHALVSTVAADLGNTVLYPSLCTGGALHLLPREVTTSGERFAAYVRDHGIDVLKIVPSHLAALLGAGGPEVLPRRLLVLGGEASQAAWVDELRERAPGLAVFNHYGPTETTVGVLTHRVDGGGAGGGTVPLGRPLAGTRVYVLDRAGQPVPAGMSGELYVGGAQVARGYAGQPAQTAERFVPDGLGEEPGARLYRTGDRVRWRPSGELEFLGRVDAQVKVRGFRVELGEIEAMLALHAAVREAVVVLRDDAQGQPRLVAYVVAEAGEEVAGAGLREFLGERLPEYMVPAAVVALERLPLNANGKLDRRALPAPEETARYVAPRTPTEEVLAGIWAEVLKADRVGVEDSFFEIGGHSLRAMQVVARIRKTLGARVPMRVLFEATTVAALAAHVDGLRGGAAAAPAIEPVPRGGPLPLSFAQQRLWLVDRMDPGNPAYNMPYALRLRGALDVDALRWSLGVLVERHEPLRTVFAEHAGEPVQVIRAPAAPELEVVDLAGRVDAEEEAVRLAEEEALRPFDLAAGPLLRTTLLRLAADDHVLLFTMHHIVSDGWSRDVLVREVSALYAARGRGREPGLPHLPVQYADYAAWQRARLGAGGLEAQAAWWKEVLAGAPPLLELPVDRPRTAGGSARSGSRGFALSRELTDRLRALARAEGATLFMTLLAGWQALLGRYSGQDDVVVGTPVAGRTRTELEGLIGFFVNMLALRADLGGDPTAAALLARVRDGALGAYDHQEVPFERLVDALVTERSLAHTPLFQVIFSLDRDSSTGGQRLSLGGVRLEPFGGSEIVSKFDLKLAAVDAEDGVAGALVYRTALFDDATAERMAAHLAAMLEAMAADPSRRLSEVPLLGAAERARLLEAGSGAAADFPRELCVHERFAEQAARTPDAPAVVWEDRTLTYAELELAANRLAHRLRRLGVGPETRVGLLAERSADLLAALLGILKAGGAYVPLDPAAPPARWSALLADAGAPVLVAQAHLAARLDGYAGAVVRPDADRESIAREPGDAPAAGVHPRNLAYVLYTSGSTGAPKGVLVEHRSVLNLAAALDRAVYGRRGTDAPPRVSMNGPVFFDTSVKQWVRLLSGAAVCVVPEEARGDARALAAWTRLHAVEVLDCTPSQLRVLLAEGLLEDGSGLTDLLVAGEALDRDLWATLAAGGPRAWNLYGPTECTVDASIGEVRGERPTIGRPVANARLYVLDPAGRPAPLGVPGELFVGGEGVARGYLGQPALTAASFVPDPFGEDAGGRLYRTGDRARWLAGGEIEYLGRMDQQLKLRGFRIEPGEIEAALLEHAAVREAAVVAREDAPGRQRLVAYVVPAEGETMAAPALREHLSARLPEYMVPAAYVALERLPLTRNGKLDRRALPAPEAADGEGRRAPRTATEEVLAGIWAEVLGVERVGAEDAFFELGGHSLLATRVVSRVREALGVELPLRAVFEAPTVAGLAARIDALRLAGAAALPAIRRVPRGGPLPASFAQQRLWVVDRLEPGSSAYNMPAALRLRGPLDVAALRRGLDALAARHETLRTTLEERGGEPVQVVHPPAPVPLPVVEVAGEAEAATLAAAEARRPFDLAAGPLLRCALLRLAPDDHVVLFTLHHVVSDAWSNRVLVGELSALYGAFARGAEPALPELPVQYADYAAWQRAWAAGGLLEEQVGWWRERLAGAPPLLEIPVDRPRVPGVDDAAGTHAVALSPELSAGLRALARREGATLFMTVLAAWQALLGRWAGQDDVVVGTPVAGRTRAELEGLIGFFVNMLPLRAELGGGATWRELLARVREGALGAYAHQELPFERLVEELATERSLAHAPLFQVTFSLERPESAAAVLPGGGPALEAFGEAGAAAQFDLDLTLADEGDALRGGIRYRAALFDAATAARMAAHLEALLAAMAADPEARHAGVTLLPEAERDQVLAAGRGEARPFPGDALVHELIAARAAAAPEAPAVAGGGRVMGYGELVDASGRLAARLRSAGVGPEVPVAVVLDRSAELGVALLAVLRAGGAFVPVDPGYPRERVEYLLADSGAPVVVTRSALAAALPESAAAVLCVDAAEDEAASHSGTSALPRPPSSDALAYLVYTSGSTGRPKAAMVSHRSLVCYAEAMRERMELRPADRVLQFASPAFDVMIEEVFPAWLGGACVVFPGGDLLGSPRELSRVLEEERVSVVELPTAFWHEWVRDLAEAGAALPAGLRLVLVGGERVLAERLEQWARLGRPLLHVFGLTETTVTSTTLRLEAGEDGSRWPNLPVGAPLANARVYVLDGEREPVPAGIPGELYVGGETVARGYHARPELTAERYVPDPFSAEGGARLYRTGDRVRMPAGGGLEFLGRIDQQVKIRGYRIEPAEVEAVLCMHPAVRQAAVVVRPDPRGEAALVGYVAAEGAADPAAGELRAWLRARLPEHMVPAALVTLGELPLTPNGKTDRRALPAPEWGGEAEYVAPATAAGELLAGIWEDVLRLDRVGADENFFELGGHSLLATQVVSRVRDALGVELPLRALFEAPTVAGLAGRVDELRRAGAGGAPPPLARVPRGSALPASFAQRRLWVVDRLEPGGAAYNVPFALRVRGPLDVAALRASLDALVERHEVLRTVFREQDGEPVQVVHAAAPVALAVADAADEADAERFAREEALRPFDLEAGPLLRAALLRLGEGDHVLLFTLHHVVSDGWSMRVLVREVSALYGAASRGGTAALPGLPVQYADYAAWQRAWLAGGALEAQLAWWRERLAGAPPLLEVPTDRPRAPGQSPLAASVAFELSPALSHGLRRLSRREGATLFMTLLAGWQALLARYSGQDDLVVGTPVAGRSRVETEGLIGFFVNMLALRADLSGNPTWTGLLGRVREAALGAYDHQDVPFERLVEVLGVERSLTHSPLVQAIFSLGGDAVTGGQRLSLGEAVLETFGAGEEVSKFDLKLGAADREEGLAGALVYRSALFDAATAARMAGHLEILLEAMASEPAGRVREVPLLRGAQREQVLEEWNATAAHFPPACVHERFAQQAALTPDAPAVVHGGGTLTYAELERRANRLAHHLRSLGAGPEARVALLLERGAAATVALLGILKAGAAYVPLDPSYPDERLRFVVADSGCRLAVSAGALGERIAGSGAEVVDLDADAPRIAAGPDHAPESGVGPLNLAYVIYTSGSTGTPKGVLVEHRALSNYLAWFDREVLGEEGFALPLVSRLAFDAHVRQLFPPLLRGAAAWVLPEEVVGDPEALLAALCTRERVSFGGVPSLWGAMLERIRSGESPKPAGLVAVLLGGDALPQELAERTFEAFPDVALRNHYGPTEATVNIASGRVRPGGRVTLGRPVANVRVYLLDGNGTAVPAGVPGELHAGGAGVTRGYLGRPELTAERYLPDPFSGVAGARLYRTGDRARWRMDGELEYLGRADDQVKVRGFRIEPGEVAAALESHPHVREAAVVVRDDAAGTARLAAYVVARDGAEVGSSALREHLRRRLPEYMVPPAFVVLAELPLTANGKVDLRSLPAPAPADAAGEYLAPRTPAEEILAGIYAEVLGTERVGAGDGFFELGGHSLLATRVVSRVREAFGVELPLRALFEAPSVAGLAERIGRLQAAGGGPQAPPLVRVPRDGSPLPLSFAQQRLWFIDRLEPGSAAYNMPFALRLRGAFDPAVLERGLAEIVRRHETLRTVFATADGEPVQVVHDDVAVALPVTDLRGLPETRREAEVLRLAAAEAARPFDLAAGPLLRASAVRLADAEWAVLFTMHHIVSDGWSTGVLVRELSALYDAVAERRDAELPELPVQYADYAAWQRAWLAGEALEARLAFWRERLADAPPLLELPTDHPRPQAQDPRGGSVSIHLSPDVARELRALSRREGATVFMALLAAWQLLLARYAGVEDVSVGTPIAGRTRLETEPLIGFFVNTLVLRTDLSGAPTFAELLGRVRETTLGAYQHQEVPFERLVEELAPERSLTHTPLFQVMFALQNNERGGLRMGELEVEPLAAPGEGIARFDLTLALAEDERGIGGSLVYRAQLWERATVERMAGHFARLAEALVADPARPAFDAVFLDDGEREQLRAGWSAARVDAPAGEPVHELVAAQARRTPAAVALVHGDGTTTYAELDAAADRLATLLRRRGVGPEIRVGVLLERTPEMVAALLAVLRSGGAYVPLDPAHPDERLRFVLADSGAAAVVTRGGMAARIGGFAGAVVLLDGEDHDSVGDADARSHSPLPENAAYVIYTSGSTGTPKGVAVTHGALANLVRWHRRAFAVTAADRATQLAGLGFDASVWELWPYLASGAAVHLVADEETRSSSAALRAFLLEREVSVAFAPTPLAEALLALEWPAEAPLRLLLTGGDALRGRPREGLPFALVNNYGPTENTVVTTSGVVAPGRGNGRAPAIGRAIDNVRAYVLDARLAPVPVGVPGELCAGGAQVARGYLGRADLTAERFAPDPYGAAGGRLYRTGDRARLLASGELEYLGRMDQQVKVRGFRIEPGEVEAVLRRHAAVAEAAVVARADASGGARLVAYVVPVGVEVAAAELRAHLRAHLPEYMVPSALVTLAALPLTASGKLDRRALPDPAAHEAAGGYLAPRTPDEEILAGIFEDVLRVERVGVEDGFFELGGHSLLATRVVSRVREAFGVELPLRALFEAPTVGVLAGRIDALRGADGGPQAPPLVRVPRDGSPLPLSFAQQRLWFIDRLEPGSAAYNMPFALRLRGAFDPAALERALAEIVRRHETLRTVFATVDGEPVQVVRDEAAVALPVADLRGLPEALREAEVLRLASAEAARPFDLAAGPLLRASAVRLADVEWAVLFTMHHIVSDGWSVGVLVRELSALYDAIAEGRDAELPALPVQYADYAAWQRAWLAGDALEARLAFWREKLADAPPLLELPTDHPRPQAQDPRGGSVGIHLSAELARELRALSRREGATVFMTLLAAWQLLLARYAGVEDVSVGTPIAGRTRLETEPLIGFFVNTLVLRTDLSGEPTFRELLARVRETTLGAYQHQEVPFERLVEELAPERSLAHTPLFQAMFVLQNNEGGELRMGELEVEPLAAAGEGAARFDLTLALAEDEGGVRGSIAFRAELWERATMVRMAGHFVRLAEALIADPARPAADVPFLGAEERDRLLVEWNATDAGYPAGALVHDLFAAQAARTPDAVALVFGGEATTYAELDAAANRLAGLLRRRGVGPESRVGVALERRPELLVALLGVLKAGGAYVPLDPAHPRGRLEFMVEDAAVELVVTTTRLAGRVPGAPVLALDAAAAELAAEPAGAPESGVAPENLSHVIFTSGSTGRPKGVMIRHASTAVLMHWMRDHVSDEERSGVLWSTSTSFDVSVAEVFGTLCWGGRLVLVENALALPEVAEQGIVYASMVPTAAAELLRMGAIPPTVRTLNLAGEALPNELAQALHALGTVRTVGNLYGPTEDTTYSTYSRVEPGADRVLVGRPVADTRAYVLDDRLAPVPVGVVGELHLAGAGTARGYAGHPELTAERFLPDPYGAPGTRMYRVIDRARWTPGGELEYFGRADFQVKVRGFRIEPGEVEAVLLRHDGVAAAAVVARGDASGNARLVAYVVPAGGEVAPAGLRAHLREFLPEYMVPSALVPLAALPLTASGKLDRRALPDPAAHEAAGGYLAPRTPDEEILAGIFEDVLRVERVGAEDGFFDLGGHSLLATRVVSRVREAFGVELPLRALFEAPTVGALAARIDALRGEDTGPQAPPLVRVPRDGSPLPLSFAQQRLWFIDRLEPGSAAYNMPFALRLRGRFDPAVLERGLAEIVRRHETLRTVFATTDGEPVQVVHDDVTVALPVADLRDLPEALREAEVLRLASAEAGRPFDLAAGPLLRASAVRLADAEWVVLFTMHHVVSDGWSMGVLVRELSALYDAIAEGRRAELPALPVQYADYAAWQRAWLAGDVLEARLAFWRERLADAPPLLELPTDHPRPQMQDPRGGSVGVHLSADLARELRALSRRERATVFMTLLAAWQLLLARYAGVEDVSVGTPIAGRTRLETEPLIGFFVNTLVLRTDLSGEPTFRELLGRVRETTLGAYQHQEVPFERLVEELAPERSLAHTPLFQAMFTLQNDDRGGLRMGGLDVRPLGAGAEGIAKFDLTLGLAADEQGIGGSLTYRAELWERATMERMAGHFARLLEALVAAPDLVAADAAFLGAEEREQLLVEWTDTAAGYPAGELVHELFAAQAARTPDAVALVFGADRMTYAELDAASNRLAGLLRRRGVGPETRVGVFLERRPELVAALLGVLKAGCAYVPLDPAYPRERLGWMIEDAAVALVLTTTRLADRVPGAPVLALDAAAAELSAEPASAPESGALPENLSHVIFTSGSTGRPKGVMIRHSSVAVLLRWLRDAVSDEERTGVLFSTSVNFDVSVAEVFGTLAWGGRLVLVENALALPDVAGQGIVYASMVPTAAAELLRSGGIPASVKTLNLGGEPLPVGLAQGLHSLGTVRTVGNLYGPTEDTTYSTYARVEPGAGRVLVGRPVADTRAYVLDDRLNPVPVGVAGELYLAGGGTARGYAGRAELTAERFLPDPFGAPGTRMYRVMDRVRWTPGGELEYFGRTDFQVKVRGFRIELGEIEAALELHQAVRRAVAVVREDPASGVAGDRRIVAYVVGSAAEAGAAGLRVHLRERLPEYMIPAAFVALEELPLTASGKVDRRALPEPGAGEAAREEYAAPRDALEATIAGIFEEVLGVARVGVRDGFFDLGGHSLLAVQVVSRVEKATGVRLPVAALFTAPTVEQLAEEVRRGGGGPRPLLAPIRPGGSRAPLFLVHPVGGDVMAYAALATALHPEQPVYALRARGVEPGENPNWTVEEMARDYLAELRREQPAGPYRLGGWSMGGVVAFEMARRLEAEGERVDRLVMADSQVPWLRDPDRDMPRNEFELVRLFVRDLGLEEDPLPPAPGAGESEYLHQLLESARLAGALPAGLDPGRMHHLYGIFRINLKALYDYRPGSYAGPATLLRPASRGIAERLLERRTVGWERVVRGGVEVRTVPGDHYTMVRDPQAAALAREIERALE